MKKIKLFSLALMALFATSSWAVSITWDFSDRAAQTFENGKSYSFTATNGTTEMRYSAGSSDAIVAKNGTTLGYLFENGKTGGGTVYDIDESTNIGKNRLIRLFVSGAGKLTINGTSAVFKVLNGAANGTTLISSLNVNTKSSEITVTTSPIWIETTTKGNITSIIWSPSAGPFNITYDANGGTGTMTDDHTYEKNETVTVLDNVFTAPTGTTFGGWNTKADGSGTAYAEGAEFAATDDITLYAQWVYPATGTGTISYALTKGSANVTGTVTGVSTISSLSTSLTKSTLTISSNNSKDNYAGRCESIPTAFSESAYLDVQFTLADGYSFNPSSVSVQINPFSSTSYIKAKVAIIDEQATPVSVLSDELSCAQSTDNAITFASGAFTGKLFKGTIHMRIYLYCSSSGKNCYLKSPLSITGTVAEVTNPTAIDNTADEVKAIKSIENGQLVIEMNGVRYNALGQVIR